MKRLTDEQLDRMLSDYCKAESEDAFVYSPEKGKKAAVVPFWADRRVLAAASLVLVSALSVSIYFLIGNKIDTPIVVLPSAQSTDASTENGGGRVREGGAVASTEAPGGDTSETTSGGLLDMIESFFRNPDGRSETTATEPSGGTRRTPSRTNPTTANGSQQSPTQNGGQGALPFGPPKPISDPTSSPAPSPTSAPVSDPTEYCDPPWNEEPTDPPDVDIPVPTEGGEPMFEPITAVFTGSFDRSLIGNSGAVYCKVFDNNGVRQGSADLYDASHLASVTGQSGGTTTAVYELTVYDEGFYNYVFYNEYGKRLCQGQLYVE